MLNSTQREVKSQRKTCTNTVIPSHKEPEADPEIHFAGNPLCRSLETTSDESFEPFELRNTVRPWPSEANSAEEKDRKAPLPTCSRGFNREKEARYETKQLLAEDLGKFHKLSELKES